MVGSDHFRLTTFGVCEATLVPSLDHSSIDPVAVKVDWTFRPGLSIVALPDLKGEEVNVS